MILKKAVRKKKGLVDMKEVTQLIEGVGREMLDMESKIEQYKVKAPAIDSLLKKRAINVSYYKNQEGEIMRDESLLHQIVKLRHFAKRKQAK